jgi:hypothetical protein
MNKQIVFLKENIKSAQKFLRQAEDTIASTNNETDKLIARLEKNTYLKQIRELQENLYLARAEHDPDQCVFIQKAHTITRDKEKLLTKPRRS